ncbi:MAG: hypothetical protein OXF47_04490, partial [Nitrospira sp.]|nr:hypothetical protein [Nitrospira sp.]
EVGEDMFPACAGMNRVFLFSENMKIGYIVSNFHDIISRNDSTFRPFESAETACLPSSRRRSAGSATGGENDSGP